MKIKTIVYHNNSVRHQISLQKFLLSKYNNIFKNLLIFKKTEAGRNKTGRITVRHQGRGVKKLTHILNKKEIFYKSLNLLTMYNAKASSYISLNFDLKKKSFFKTIAIKNVLPGSLLLSTLQLKDYKLGFKTQLRKIPLGTLINSVTKKLKKTFAKSAGNFCQLIDKKNKKAKIRLPSGKIILLEEKEFGAFGIVDNSEKIKTKIGKAGRNRLIGVRPSVRGIAMNPVDHPNGGKSNKGKPSLTPWGLPTRNYPTTKKKYEQI